jgi:carbon-monoxide dehydrogenase large subunit
VTTKGVGARLPRKEDRRFLRGEAEYISNIRLPGMLEVAFVRSQMAHARLGKIVKPGGKEDCVFTAEDLVDVSASRRCRV